MLRSRHITSFGPYIGFERIREAKDSSCVYDMVCNSAANIIRSASTLLREGYGFFHACEPAFRVNVNLLVYNVATFSIIDQIQSPIPNDAKYENWPANPDINQFWSQQNNLENPPPMPQRLLPIYSLSQPNSEVQSSWQEYRQRPFHTVMAVLS